MADDEPQSMNLEQLEEDYDNVNKEIKRRKLLRDEETEKRRDLEQQIAEIRKEKDQKMKTLITLAANIKSAEEEREKLVRKMETTAKTQQEDILMWTAEIARLAKVMERVQNEYDSLQNEFERMLSEQSSDEQSINALRQEIEKSERVRESLMEEIEKSVRRKAALLRLISDAREQQERVPETATVPEIRYIITGKTGALEKAQEDALKALKDLTLVWPRVDALEVYNALEQMVESVSGPDADLADELGVQLQILVKASLKHPTVAIILHLRDFRVALDELNKQLRINVGTINASRDVTPETIEEMGIVDVNVPQAMTIDDDDDSDDIPLKRLVPNRAISPEKIPVMSEKDITPKGIFDADSDEEESSAELERDGDDEPQTMTLEPAVDSDKDDKESSDTGKSPETRPRTMFEDLGLVSSDDDEPQAMTLEQDRPPVALVQPPVAPVQVESLRDLKKMKFEDLREEVMRLVGVMRNAIDETTVNKNDRKEISDVLDKIETRLSGLTIQADPDATAKKLVKYARQLIVYKKRIPLDYVNSLERLAEMAGGKNIVTKKKGGALVRLASKYDFNKDSLSAYKKTIVDKIRNKPARKKREKKTKASKQTISDLVDAVRPVIDALSNDDLKSRFNTLLGEIEGESIEQARRLLELVLEANLEYTDAFKKLVKKLTPKGEASQLKNLKDQATRRSKKISRDLIDAVRPAIDALTNDDLKSRFNTLLGEIKGQNTNQAKRLLALILEAELEYTNAFKKLVKKLTIKGDASQLKGLVKRLKKQVKKPISPETIAAARVMVQSLPESEKKQELYTLLAGITTQDTETAKNLVKLFVQAGGEYEGAIEALAKELTIRGETKQVNKALKQAEQYKTLQQQIQETLSALDGFVTGMDDAPEQQLAEYLQTLDWANDFEAVTEIIDYKYWMDRWSYNFSPAAQQAWDPDRDWTSRDLSTPTRGILKHINDLVSTLTPYGETDKRRAIERKAKKVYPWIYPLTDEELQTVRNLSKKILAISNANNVTEDGIATIERKIWLKVSDVDAANPAWPAKFEEFFSQLGEEDLEFLAREREQVLNPKTGPQGLKDAAEVIVAYTDGIGLTQNGVFTMRKEIDLNVPENSRPLRDLDKAIGYTYIEYRLGNTLDEGEEDLDQLISVYTSHGEKKVIDRQREYYKLKRDFPSIKNRIEAKMTRQRTSRDQEKVAKSILESIEMTLNRDEDFYTNPLDVKGYPSAIDRELSSLYTTIESIVGEVDLDYEFEDDDEDDFIDDEDIDDDVPQAMFIDDDGYSDEYSDEGDDEEALSLESDEEDDEDGIGEVITSENIYALGEAEESNLAMFYRQYLSKRNFGFGKYSTNQDALDFVKASFRVKGSRVLKREANVPDRSLLPLVERGWFYNQDVYGQALAMKNILTYVTLVVNRLRAEEDVRDLGRILFERPKKARPEVAYIDFDGNAYDANFNDAGKVKVKFTYEKFMEINPMLLAELGALVFVLNNATRVFERDGQTLTNPEELDNNLKRIKQEFEKNFELYQAAQTVLTRYQLGMTKAQTLTLEGFGPTEERLRALSQKQLPKKGSDEYNNDVEFLQSFEMPNNKAEFYYEPERALVVREEVSMLPKIVDKSRLSPEARRAFVRAYKAQKTGNENPVVRNVDGEEMMDDSGGILTLDEAIIEADYIVNLNREHGIENETLEDLVEMLWGYDGLFDKSIVTESEEDSKTTAKKSSRGLKRKRVESRIGAFVKALDAYTATLQDHPAIASISSKLAKHAKRLLDDKKMVKSWTKLDKHMSAMKQAMGEPDSNKAAAFVESHERLHTAFMEHLMEKIGYGAETPIPLKDIDVGGMRITITDGLTRRGLDSTAVSGREGRDIVGIELGADANYGGKRWHFDINMTSLPFQDAWWMFVITVKRHRRLLPDPEIAEMWFETQAISVEKLVNIAAVIICGLEKTQSCRTVSDRALRFLEAASGGGAAQAKIKTSRGGPYVPLREWVEKQ